MFNIMAIYRAGLIFFAIALVFMLVGGIGSFATSDEGKESVEAVYKGYVVVPGGSKSSGNLYAGFYVPKYDKSENRLITPYFALTAKVDSVYMLDVNKPGYMNKYGLFLGLGFILLLMALVCMLITAFTME